MMDKRTEDIEKLVEQIVLAIRKITQEPIPEKTIEEIRKACSILPRKPEVKIIQNPKEFDECAKPKEVDYQGTFGDRYRSSIKCQVLYGNYTPGISKFIESAKAPGKSQEQEDISDFSMNKMQVVLSRDIYREYNNTLILYIPEQKEWEETSFARFIKNEQRQTLFQKISDAVKGTMTDEEIWEIVNNFDFSNGIPEIRIITDPDKFDDIAIERDEMYSDTSEYDKDLFVETKTLHGDYTPGKIESLEYRGFRGCANETIKDSNFSLNRPQLALVSTYKYRRFYNSNSEKRNTEIVIYVPERKHEEQTYKQYRERRTHSPIAVTNFIKAYIPNIDPEKLKKKFTPSLEDLIKKCDEVLDKSQGDDKADGEDQK